MPPVSRGQNGLSNTLGYPSKSSPDLPTLRRLSLSTGSKSLLDETNDAEKDHNNNNSNNTNNNNNSSSSDNDKPLTNLRKYHTSQPRFNHTHLNSSSSQLFPPFYNRPPTPLPPSPSLTSLLRPSFSTHTSRHTTPESSDVESTVTGTATAASVEKSAQVARASPKVPTYEYYGFALYLASSAAFLIYVLWAYLPSPFLHQLGIYYYINRWWALALPAWLVISVIYIYVALASYNTGFLTLSMPNIENLVDEAAQVAVLDKEGKIIKRFQNQLSKSGKIHVRNASSSGSKNAIDWKHMWDHGTDAVLDIPIGGVCEILYGEKKVT